MALGWRVPASILSEGIPTSGSTIFDAAPSAPDDIQRSRCHAGVVTGRKGSRLPLRHTRRADDRIRGGRRVRCDAEAGLPTDSMRGQRLVAGWQIPGGDGREQGHLDHIAGAGGQAAAVACRAVHRRDARISPDGRWLAYVSEESGRPEVSVRSLAGPPRRFVVSSGGGDQPGLEP